MSVQCTQREKEINSYGSKNILPVFDIAQFILKLNFKNLRVPRVLGGLIFNPQAAKNSATENREILTSAVNPCNFTQRPN